MSLRVNPDNTQTLLDALQRVTAQQQTALQELATGQRINALSDDPASAARMVQIQTLQAQDDQYSANIGNVQSMLQTADSTLNGVVQSLNQAISLGTEGANGTLSDANRQAIANQVDSLQQQLVSYANATYAGRYLFAGTAVTAAPFVADGSSPSGVKYVGNDNVTTFEAGTGNVVAMNVPGSAIFSKSGADVFQALHDLSSALRSNSAIHAATIAVQKAFDNVTTQRVFYGNTVAQLGSLKTSVDNDKFQLTSQASVVDGADLAAVAAQLNQTTTSRNALLSGGARIAQLSLLDYLR